MNDTRVKNCAKTLASLDIPKQDILDSRDTWEGCEELRLALCCPAVDRAEKHRVIDRAFPKSMGSFLKVMEKYGHLFALSDIISEYEKLKLDEKNALSCRLYCASEPDEATVKRFKDTLCKKYHTDSAELEVVIDPSLIGGYALQVGDKIYDKSVKSAMQALHKQML